MDDRFEIQIEDVRCIACDNPSNDLQSGKIARRIEEQLNRQGAPGAERDARFRVVARIIQGREPSIRPDIDNYVRPVVNSINARTLWRGAKLLWKDDTQVDEYEIYRIHDDAAQSSKVTLWISKIGRRSV